MARPRAIPRTTRGRQILKLIDEQGLTLSGAAKHVGVSFRTLSDVIHKPELDSISLLTIERVCSKLNIPLAIISPTLARLSA